MLISATVAVGCVSLTPEELRKKPFVYVYDVTLKKDLLFNKSLEWLAISYKSAKAVIELQDKPAGKIIGRGNSSVYYRLDDRKFSYLIQIDVKDNRARIMFSQLEAIGATYGEGRGAPLEYLDVYNLVIGNLDSLAKNYFDFISSKKTDAF